MWDLQHFVISPNLSKLIISLLIKCNIVRAAVPSDCYFLQFEPEAPWERLRRGMKVTSIYHKTLGNGLISGLLVCYIPALATTLVCC